MSRMEGFVPSREIFNDNIDTLDHLAVAHCRGGYPGVPSAGLCLLPGPRNRI